MKKIDSELERLSVAIQKLQAFGGKSPADEALIVALKAIYEILDRLA